MSKYGPASSFILIDGKDLSSDVFNLGEDNEGITQETTGFHTNMESHAGVGLGRVMLTADGGFYDDRQVGMLQAFQGAGATPRIVLYGMAGDILGRQVRMLGGTVVTHWNRIFEKAGLTKGDPKYVISARPYDGAIVSPFTSRAGNGQSQATSLDLSTYPTAKLHTAVPTVANPTVMTVAGGHGLTTGDWVLIVGTATTPTTLGFWPVTVLTPTTYTIPVNVSASGAQPGWMIKSNHGAQGFVADLHLLELTLGGATNVIVKMRHSADNISFSDVVGGAFGAKTVPGVAERVTMTGQLLNRYVAIQWDGTGAAPTSLTPFVGLGI
jgi:hypothetical protein